jgi:hypothetical protein
MDICMQGRIGSPNFGKIFFQGAPKKKKSCYKNEIADLKKKKKGNDAEGPPIALG